MFSLGSHLALSNSSVVHAIVDSFFLGKKAQVKERLRQSMESIVDGLFEEMVEQVKEMLLPPKVENNVQVKSSLTEPNTSPVKSVNTLPAFEKPKTNPVFATKSKPGLSTSTQQHQQPPFSGQYKRMAEEDGCSIHPKKKQAITVELEFDDQFEDDSLFTAETEDDAGEVANKCSNQIVTAKAVNHTSSENSKLLKAKQGKKFTCLEADCGKQFRSNADMRKHMRVHSKVKPFGCTYPGCSLEFNIRGNAIRHILNIHLKKKAGNAEDADSEGGGDSTDPPDPATYLSVKEDLL